MVSSAVLQRTLKLHHYLKRLEKIFITVSANLPKQATRRLPLKALLHGRPGGPGSVINIMIIM